ncbi:MAG: hypothetical protein ACK5LC_05140 [Coprobacillaceae bacterium]
MISSKLFIEYEPQNRKSVLDFLAAGEKVDNLFSNVSELTQEIRNTISTLLLDKDKNAKTYTLTSLGNQYQNIYAHGLTLTLPKELDVSMHHDFVKAYMLFVSSWYKIVPYIYSIFPLKNNYQVVIYAFTKYVYKRKVKKVTMNTRDYYYLNGRTCKKTVPGAEHKIQKGTPKLDKEGNVIYEELVASKKEYRIFYYKSFLKFTQKLKKYIIYAMRALVPYKKYYKYISLVNYYKGITMYLVNQRLQLKNNLITEVNDKLRSIQDGLIVCKLLDDKYAMRLFHKSIFKINQLIHTDTKSQFTDEALIDLDGQCQNLLTALAMHLFLDHEQFENMCRSSTYFEKLKKTEEFYDIGALLWEM